MLNKSLQVAGTFMATTLALAVTAQNAEALNFTFSFDNDISLGNIPGTVSGTIIGLEDNTSNQAADSVIIESFEVPGSFNNGNDAVAWSFVGINSFTVNNGIITDASFLAQENGGDGQDLLRFSADPFGESLNRLSLDGSNSTSNFDGFSGVTFAPASSTPVPFGVIPDTGIGILAGMWGISRLRKTLTARKSLNK